MSGEDVTEVFFYHLERAPLERVLPGLLEKSLDRGWCAVVQAASQERIEAIDTLLWTYRDEAFLPHATAKEGNQERQPVFLTIEDENPNDAQIRFFIDGAHIGDLSSYVRVVYLFDGHDEDALGAVRAHWKDHKQAGYAVTYWQQSGEGRWEKKA